MFHSVKVGEGCAYCYLDTFDRIHHQNSKFAVENVMVPYCLESSSVNEIVRITSASERDKITAESVVIDRRQDFDEMIPVGL